MTTQTDFIHPNLHVRHEQLAAVCEKWKIIDFELFGSVLREDFTAESDVDVMLTFAPNSRHTILDIVRIGNELEALFGRPVDIAERRAVERSANHISRKSILGSAKRVYAAV